MSLEKWKGSEEHDSVVVDDVTAQDVSPAKHLQHIYLDEKTTPTQKDQENFTVVLENTKS